MPTCSMWKFYCVYRMIIKDGYVVNINVLLVEQKSMLNIRGLIDNTWYMTRLDVHDKKELKERA